MDRQQRRRRVDGVLLLDKPAGMSSNAALQQARRLLEAAKAGHTGTLDPLATGLLPLCFGEATKFAGALLEADKCYQATIRLGIVTDTADAEGRVLQTREVATDAARVAAVLAQFRGEIEQRPPMYSALKRDGRPLYEYARRGLEVERTPRRVTIHRLELVRMHDACLDIVVECSKGTYVRSLAQDIGERLGCGGHLAALRRSRIGPLDVSQAVTLADLEALPPQQRAALLRPPDALLAALPRLDLDAAAARRLLHGQAQRQAGAPAGRVRLYGPGGAFLGLAQADVGGLLTPLRMLAPVPAADGFLADGRGRE